MMPSTTADTQAYWIQYFVVIGETQTAIELLGETKETIDDDEGFAYFQSQYVNLIAEVKQIEKSIKTIKTMPVIPKNTKVLGLWRDGKTYRRDERTEKAFAHAFSEMTSNSN